MLPRLGPSFLASCRAVDKEEVADPERLHAKGDSEVTPKDFARSLWAPCSLVAFGRWSLMGQ